MCNEQTSRQHLATEADTLALGARLAARYRHGLVFLTGELGAGKTTLVRGWLRALGHTGAVKSPTYTLVEPYETGEIPVYHFDLYRLGEPEELEFVGIRDYLTAGSLCLVEWPERAGSFLPAPVLCIQLEDDPPGRQATMISQTGEVIAL